MPAAYAHHRFGEACLQTMPKKLRAICERYRELYDFGVHGPDLLFYYDPLSSNEVNGHGSELHHWSGMQFFEICKYVYGGMDGQLELKSGNKHALLAYMLGFLAHFTLDSSCHGYINEMTENTGISHNKIESQYEAYLLRKDGIDPLQYDRSRPLKPRKKNARVVSYLFPFDEKQILKSMKGQRMVLRLFYSPKEIKKNLVRDVIAKLNMKGDFGDLFLDRETLFVCEEMNEYIFKCTNNAEKIYPQLLENLMSFFDGKEELDVYFNHDFEGELH